VHSLNLNTLILILINIMKIKTFLLLVLFFSTFCFSSCSMFKKKNKCDTCPSWTQDQKTSFEELDTKS